MADLVTQHALIRYCERVLEIDGLDADRPDVSLDRLTRRGYPIPQIRAALTAIVADAVAVGAERFVRDGMTYCIANGLLVTILPGRPRSHLGISKSAGQRAAYEAARIAKGKKPQEGMRFGDRQMRRWHP